MSIKCKYIYIFLHILVYLVYLKNRKYKKVTKVVFYIISVWRSVDRSADALVWICVLLTLFIASQMAPILRCVRIIFSKYGCVYVLFLTCFVLLYKIKIYFVYFFDIDDVWFDIYLLCSLYFWKMTCLDQGFPARVIRGNNN